VVLAACSASDVPPVAVSPVVVTPAAPATAPESPAASPTGGPGESPTAPGPIRIAGLPEQGVAIERDGGVDLVDFFGRRVAHLDGFTIFQSTDAPGNLVLARGSGFFLLEEFRRRLRPLASERAARRWQEADENHPDFPAPRSGGKPMTGHWRYSVSDPRYGDRFLAQWSGECEAPIAFFVDRDEGEVEPVTGEADPATAPESFALGWNKRGQAVLFLPQGECGAGARRPGVYLSRDAGEGHLLVGTPPGATARMWGTTVAG
jgi:hypothetical protein